jgi:hypothetical protein
MQIDAATATVIAAIVGAGVGGFVTLFGQWLTRRSEERRHIRQLVVQTAIENWRFTSDAAEKLAASGYPVDRYPLDSFVLHMLKLSEVLDERRITPVLAKNSGKCMRSPKRLAKRFVSTAKPNVDEKKPNQKSCPRYPTDSEKTTIKE